MTSEVLILNKRAAVLAADSAVTTTHGQNEKRYSKSATKVFDLTNRGNVGVMIFGSAQIDGVPWELAIKLFRTELGDRVFDSVSEYVDALLTFLSGHAQLFPADLREQFVPIQFDWAVVEVMKLIDTDVRDQAIPLANRRARWATSAAELRDRLVAKGVAPMLDPAALEAHLLDLDEWIERAEGQLADAPSLDAVDARELAELAHRLRYCQPESILADTGVVVAGFGSSEIFPAARRIRIHGHVGSRLFYAEEDKHAMSHLSDPLVVGLAQTSMIDLFTLGYGIKLWTIVHRTSEEAIQGIFDKLSEAGVEVAAETSARISVEQHEKFMRAWVVENYQQNFMPLLRVVSHLDVEEMADLAETLVTLESVKERVTSSSESVGGPIDVAVITKNEGLVWVKRKHYFDIDANMRYAARVQAAVRP